MRINTFGRATMNSSAPGVRAAPLPGATDEVDLLEEMLGLSGIWERIFDAGSPLVVTLGEHLKAFHEARRPAP